MDEKQATFTVDELSAEWAQQLAQYLQATVALRSVNEALIARIHELEIELLELRQSNQIQ